MTTENENQIPDLEQAARRRLLKLAAYTPPAILGVMIVGSKVAEAARAVPGATVNCQNGQIVVSAGGSACCPCIPGDRKYNPTKCAWKRCSFGTCSACPPGPYTSQKDCNTVAAACGCNCVRSRAGGRGRGGGSWIYNCN